MTHIYQIDHDAANAVTEMLLLALPETGERVDARDVLAGLARLVGIYIGYLEHEGLGPMDEWHKAFDHLLTELLR